MSTTTSTSSKDIAAHSWSLKESAGNSSNTTSTSGEYGPASASVPLKEYGGNLSDQSPSENTAVDLFLAAGAGICCVGFLLAFCIWVVRRRCKNRYRKQDDEQPRTSTGRADIETMGTSLEGSVLPQQLGIDTTMVLKGGASTSSIRSTLVHRRSNSDSQSLPLVTFLSHGKTEGGASARLLKLMLSDLIVAKTISKHAKEENIPLSIFLDSDNLLSLSDLMNIVKQTMTLTVLLTHSTFYRPWCICEIYTAATAGIPILPIDILGHGFDTKPSNLDEHVATRLDESGLRVIHTQCPGFTMDKYKEVILDVLALPRLKFTATASALQQWSESKEIANAIQLLAEEQTRQPLQHQGERFRICPQRSQVRSTLILRSPFSETETPIAYLIYDQSPKASAENVSIAHILQLMMEDELRECGVGGSICSNSESFMTPDLQVEMARKVPNVVVLLTIGCLEQAWEVALMVHASRAGARLIPVQIGSKFDFGHTSMPSDLFQRKFDKQARRVFKDQDISWSEVSCTLRILFDIIACDFHPRASESLQWADTHQVVSRLQQDKGDLETHEAWRQTFAASVTEDPYKEEFDDEGTLIMHDLVDFEATPTPGVPQDGPCECSNTGGMSEGYCSANWLDTRSSLVCSQSHPATLHGKNTSICNNGHAGSLDAYLCQRTSLSRSSDSGPSSAMKPVAPTMSSDSIPSDIMNPVGPTTTEVPPGGLSDAADNGDTLERIVGL